jgi:Zn ribbon nucleic-acid-binding protein
MIILRSYNILLLCDSKDVILLWKEDNVEVQKIFVTKTGFQAESSRSLFEVM